jgi:large subunit ribosomal protein L21
MYAVIETGGKQYRVAPGDVVRVEKLSAEAGDTINIDKVLMVADGDNISVGTPLVDGAAVSAKVRGHGRDKKVHIFKMRRRKDSRLQAGHRQHFTEIEITAIK